MSKWLLCGELPVLPKLISDLLSEALPHLASAPSDEAVLKDRIQFKDVAGALPLREDVALGETHWLAWAPSVSSFLPLLEHGLWGRN